MSPQQTSARAARQSLQNRQTVGSQFDQMIRPEKAPLPPNIRRGAQKAHVRPQTPAMAGGRRRRVDHRRFEPLFDDEFPICADRRLRRRSQGPQSRRRREISPWILESGVRPAAIRRPYQDQVADHPYFQACQVRRPSCAAAFAVERELKSVNGALNEVDVSGARRVQYVRRLAAAISKRAHLPRRIAHDEYSFDAEVDAEKISGARSL